MSTQSFPDLRVSAPVAKALAARAITTPFPIQALVMADALAGLPATEAEVLWLYYADGLSFEAIGERVELSRKSIRGIWARGLKNLKRTLDSPPSTR